MTGLLAKYYYSVTKGGQFRTVLYDGLTYQKRRKFFLWVVIIA